MAMTSLFELLTQYGALGVFMLVLLVQLGLPLPVLPLLLLIGSLAMGDPQLGITSLILAIIASLIGDFVWYSAGRRYGNRILHLLCQISLSPDSCVRQSEVHFQRWGVATLVIAKFIPGLATIAPPVAGVLGLRRSSFLIFSAAGAALWAGAWLVVGAVFNRQIHVVLNAVTQFGTIAVAVIGLMLVAYVLYRWWYRYRLKVVLASQRRITPLELVELLNQEHAPLIFDARSALVKSVDLQRINSARPFDLSMIAQTITEIPFDTVIVVYCSCPNDVSAIKVVQQLKQRGYSQACSLLGGIDAWKMAGFPIESYENSEYHIPVFK
jgi:membrane protein DedA with SNARE-associated domain/rhodanese-related sulfurtransferase